MDLASTSTPPVGQTPPVFPQDGGREKQVEKKDDLANRETFLQLLVAQIKNQDPLNPLDSVQFLSQLAQFSELEQLIGIRQEISNLRPPETGAGAPANQSEKPGTAGNS